MMQLMKTILLTIAVALVTSAAQASLSWSWSGSAAIPDNSPYVGAAAGIYIAPTDSQLSGIANPSISSIAAVTISITGGWAGDYTAALQHVNADGSQSQSLTLFSMLLGGTAANGGFDGLQLDSTSGTINPNFNAINSSSTQISGTYYFNFGTTFNNLSPTGDWILYVTDSQAGSQGTLAGWSLDLNVVPEPTAIALPIFGAALAVSAFLRCRRTAQ